MKFMLTPDTVLRAVTCAERPRSLYIRDNLYYAHARAVKQGATGHPPTTQQVLRRLRELERDGYLISSPHPDPMTGYAWTMTRKGWERLAICNGAAA